MTVLEKINAFVEKRNVQIYDTMPEGWKVLQGALTAPCGTTWINNGGSIINKTMETALLLDEWFMKQNSEGRKIGWCLRELRRFKDIGGGRSKLELIEKYGENVVNIAYKIVYDGGRKL